MTNVIFLDVDGVLNNGAWAMEMYELGVRVFSEGRLYEPALARLKRVVDAADAKLVVTSSWRLDPEAFERLEAWLLRFGMAVWEVVPHLGGCRGDDITAWLDRHRGEDVRFVILDDDDDMGPHTRRLVRTRFDAGLTDADAERAIEMLNDDDRTRRVILSEAKNL